ncbi:MAG: GMC family oxidoreductase N-terminal domain-containing protein [Ahrensia sp.]|nr:GMC family oxidoreductase N-terminal domain-containing protein [Ahrensia sp.]
MISSYDFIIIGAGSAGCAAAHQLAQANVGTIAVLEAGLTNKVPQVKIPFLLAWTRGSKRDWKFQSKPQSELGGRSIGVTRGKMVGGSSSINSMVWFRGRRDDFDKWGVAGWGWPDVEPAFEAVEGLIDPRPFPFPHALSSAYALALGDNGYAPPTPERESAGIFHVNLHDGARWSAADAFLEPARKSGRVDLLTKASVERIVFEDGSAKRVVLVEGGEIEARRGILLSAGSIGSPAIAMRSGIGPAHHLKNLGIEVVSDQPGVGDNLHDHPAVGLHYAGSGYGLEWAQVPHWAVSPFNWFLRRKGRLVCNIVEAGAFFRANPVGPDGDDRPDCQSHFIPVMMGYKGTLLAWGAGYSADVNICRPHSRGSLTLASADPQQAPVIDLALLRDERDVSTLVNGVKRLREVVARAPFGDLRGVEEYPGDRVQSDAEIEQFVRDRCATSYHPVGTLRMGDGDAPVSPDLRLRGVNRLWVADASIMPAVTTANTNAPSMMIGHPAGQFIARAVKGAV